MKKKNIVLISLIIIFALIFLAAAIYLVVRLVGGNNGEEEYKRLASSYASRVSELSGNMDGSEGETSSATKLAENPVNFDTLKKTNKDIYSWIYIPDTNINYPVLQSSKDDNFYLDHDTDKNYSFAGSIYSQFANRRDYTDRVTVLYGHNMKNGSMFADLHKFENTEFFKKHQYMYIYTEDRKLTYEIYSAYSYDNRHIMNSFDFSYDDVFKKFLDDSLNPRSVLYNVREGVELDIDDKVVVLSTCLNSGDGRYLVQGVLINDERTK